MSEEKKVQNDILILGIESSSMVASAAIVEDGITMAEYTANFKKTHSQTLLPMIDAMVSLLGIELSSLDAIAVSGGPGSFTGLRIGIATVRGFSDLPPGLIRRGRTPEEPL